MTRDLSTSARALGMGGAYLAISDDANALRYNPAGLARIQRVEFLGSLSTLERTIATEFHGEGREASLSGSQISALAFTYPFPTYRGSMVIALGYTAPWITDRNSERAFRESSRTFRESLNEEGEVGEWSFGYAVDVAPELALGFRTSWIHGNINQDWFYLDTEYGFDDHQVVDIDVNGFTGALGALSRVGGWGRLGLTLNLPRWIQLDQTISFPAFPDYTEILEQDLTLPFSVGVGLSAMLPNLLLAGDARLTDWTRIDYDGPLRYYEGPLIPNEPETRPRRPAYKQTWDLHFGAEYLLDALGLAGMRLRAGVAWEPVPYRILQEYQELEPATPDPDDPPPESIPVYYSARFDPDRLSFTVGLGVLLQESVTVDAGLAVGRFQRSGIDLVEEESDQRILVTAAFRLD
ncbi:MAG: hypothetical protein V1774_08070 [Candidatus Eisenbacteria bacterium]